jgi:hypothetical protein
MYICMYMYIYIDVNICIHTFIYTYTYLYISSIYIHLFIHTHIQAESIYILGRIYHAQNNIAPAIEYYKEAYRFVMIMHYIS